MIQPISAAIQIRDKFLGGVFHEWIVMPEFFDHAAIARRAGINRIQAKKRPVRPTHPL
jgi:hypothetical protein